MENEIINIDITDNKQEEIERDLLLRQSKLLYPDVEDWVLNMAIEAYQNEVKNEKDIIENVNTKIHF
jgi:hypothetical protein